MSRFGIVVPRILLVTFVVPITCVLARGQSNAQGDPAIPQSTTLESGASSTPWQFGGFIDLDYANDFNHPANHLFRNRGTTPRVDEVDVNMAAAYIRKDTSPTSRLGAELEVQTGEDSKTFGFSATAPNLPGADVLRHFGKANVSYLVPVGKGLALQGGIFSSFIGYDSLYAKDNLNYTRPWGADYTPYLMLGVNASYPLSNRLTGTLFVVNGYWHLANANSVPSFGGQLAYKASEHWTVKETPLVGPHQGDTSVQFWRWFSDSIAEWKKNRITTAFEYQVGTEKAAAINSRALWMAAQLPVHYALDKHWSASVRPECAWDRDGRWTGFPQTIKAVTSTVEYRTSFRQAGAIVRLEHRYDDSRGAAGGFFRGGYVEPGVVALTPTQHLLILGVMLTFDGSIQH